MSDIRKIIEYMIKVNKVKHMKNPVILMNVNDLKSFEEKLKEEIIGFIPNDTPKYRGIPIKIKDFIQRNQIIIYDDIF